PEPLVPRRSGGHPGRACPAAGSCAAAGFPAVTGARYLSRPRAARRASDAGAGDRSTSAYNIMTSVSRYRWLLLLLLLAVLPVGMLACSGDPTTPDPIEDPRDPDPSDP